MTAEAAHWTAEIAALLTTYLLHSTCLLGAVGLLFCCYRTANHALKAFLWKSAAIAGLITAPVACFLAGPRPLVDLHLPVAIFRPAMSEHIDNTAPAEPVTAPPPVESFHIPESDWLPESADETQRELDSERGSCSRHMS